VTGPSAGAKAQSTRDVGERAIANTLYRTVGEIAGRLASFVLFAVVARRLGENGLGAFVLAIAFLGLVMVTVDLGLDRYLLRAIAREHTAANRLFFNVLALKLTLAVPLLALGLLAMHLLGYSTQAQETALALAPGVFCDSVARTQSSLFSARERGGPPSLADALQRICSALLGLGALHAGYGVVAVGMAYSAGSLIGVLIGFVLLHRTIGLPARSLDRRRWKSLATKSVPFAAQDTFTILLARMDTLLLSLIATQAAVGRYGAAYRLFESTFFVTYALTGAFTAMYTYLGRDSTPSLRFVFQRSVKLALALLMPLAVAFAVLASPICQLVYGTTFASAAPPLRVLSAGVVLMSVVTLSVSLMVSREDPRRLVWLTGIIAAVNISLNLILIPLYSDVGAAAAMLATEVLYVTWVMHRAHHAVGGGIQWRSTLPGPLTAGATMATTGLLLHDSLLAALVAGGTVYIVMLIFVERLVAPLDVAFALTMARRRLPNRWAGLGSP
jgi:O-antigen/teichoic acid export membrane protein